MKIKGFTGFTFVELILAVSIFTVAAVAIYSTLSTGLLAWKRAQRAQGLYQDVRLALAKMEQDLENAVLFSQKQKEEVFPPNFVGQAERISFYSLVEVFSQGGLTHTELRRITYSVDESTLLRGEQTFAQAVKQEEYFEPEAMVAKISRLRFFYCYEDEESQPPYQWKDSWDFARKLPQGIKIELELTGEEKVVFTKYVFIPTGEKGKEKI